MHKNRLWLPALGPTNRIRSDSGSWIGMLSDFPQLLLLGEMPQTSPHEFDVLEHTRVVYEAARLIVNRLPDNVVGHIKYHEVLFAAALHDIGKPASKGGDIFHITFHGHEKVSADIARHMLKSEEVPDSSIDDIIKLIELHLRPAFLFREYKSTISGPTQSAINRLNRDCEGIGNELAILALADFYGKAGEDTDPALLREYVHFLYGAMFPTRAWILGGGAEALILQCESNWKPEGR